MLRLPVCFIVCALPLAAMSPAAAQSYVSDDAELSPRASSAPVPLTRPYVARNASPVAENGLLVDESQPAVPAQPQVSAQVQVSPSPRAPRLAIDSLGIGRGVIVVSNVRPNE